MNPGLTKNYDAGGAVTKRRIVKFDGNGAIVLAAAATDLLIGVSTDIDTVTGEPTDVIHGGIALIEAGGNITRGQEITSNATGQAVAAAPAGGANNRVIGIALESAVSGDLFDVLVAPSVKQG